MERNLVILTGGKSKRMGTDKALLKIGEETFVEHLINEFKSYFDNIVLSVNALGKFDELKLNKKEIVDIYSEIGPIGGIYTALKNMEAKEIFVVSVDMPLAPVQLAIKIIEFNKESDINILKRQDGNMEPLFAKYSRNCLPQMDKMIRSGNYKMHDLLKLVDTCYIDSNENEMQKLINLNTKDDYNTVIVKNGISN